VASVDERAPIGVFDSGLGGLTVLRALHERLTAEDLIYFGDTARVPYGTKGEKTVRAFARQDAGLLVARGVKMVVVACNTASAFALDYLREILPVPVLGVINPGVRTALAATAGGPVGVIGTSGTIRSLKYQEGLAAGGLDAKRIVARECPLLVPLVEEGLLGHRLTELALAEYLTAVREAGVDTLILGCTHYPLLKQEIAAFMGAGVKLVDSADALATAAQARLAALGLLRDETAGRPGELSFLLSDIPWKFQEIGARFLGKPIVNMQTVELDEMEEAGHAIG
jgi:glutamate racemase